MENFKRKSFKKNDISDTDKGVEVKNLFVLVTNNKLCEELMRLLNVDLIKNEFIEIKGARKLIEVQKELNSKYIKVDLKSHIRNISLYNEDVFSFNFNQLSEDEYFQSLNLKTVSTIPIYSSTREFFSELYQMDRYASKLISSGHSYILQANLDMIKNVSKTTKRFRILHDINENLFYLRGIISTNNYFNYDNNLAIIIGLLTLHNETKRTGVKYNIKSCEYNESFIRIFFESDEVTDLSNIGKVKNIIEVSNDEIRREALRFTGVCSIEFQSETNETQELYIRPKEIKSRIISVGHNRSPITAIQELANINNSRAVHNNLFADIAKISKIKNPEQIKHLVKSKVENVKTEEVKKFKSQILMELNKTATNIIQLLTIFGKIELLASEDIEASEFIRYIIFQALIDRK